MSAFDRHLCIANRNAPSGVVYLSPSQQVLAGISLYWTSESEVREIWSHFGDIPLNVGDPIWFRGGESPVVIVNEKEYHLSTLENI